MGFGVVQGLVSFFELLASDVRRVEIADEGTDLFNKQIGFGIKFLEKCL